MKSHHLIACLALAVLLPLAGGGCLNLKPTADPVRYFVLRPITEAGEMRGETSDGLRLGIAPVTVPNYLTKPWIVVRTSSTEIRYSDYFKWAEYLDKGVQRVVAENLAYLLGTDRVQLNSWSERDVDVELKLIIQRFEVDQGGRVVLEAFWELDGSRTWSGHRVVDLSGPAPAADPSGAIETMSKALNELSEALAAELQT